MRQTDDETEMIRWLHDAADAAVAVVLNPGAWSHYSYALRDACAALTGPLVEVHLSQTAKREEFRHTSVISAGGRRDHHRAGLRLLPARRSRSRRASGRVIASTQIRARSSYISPMATTSRGARSRQKIVAAGAELFAERGFVNTSLTDVLDRVGLTKGAFYFHFSTKEELAHAVCASYHDWLICAPTSQP